MMMLLLSLLLALLFCSFYFGDLASFPALDGLSALPALAALATLPALAALATHFSVVSFASLLMFLLLMVL